MNCLFLGITLYYSIGLYILIRGYFLAFDNLTIEGIILIIFRSSIWPIFLLQYLLA